MKEFFKFRNPEKPNGFLGSNFLNKFNNQQQTDKKTLKSRLKPLLIFLGLFILGLIFIYIFNIRSSEPAQTTDTLTMPISQPSGFELILKFIVGLVIVSVLIYLTVYLLRFFHNKKQRAGTVGKNLSNGLITVMESINLDNTKRLHLIKIADKVLLLSATENQINLIAELKEGDLKIELAALAENENQETNLSFKSFFQSFFKNKN